MTQLLTEPINDVYLRLLEPSFISYQNERIEYPITKPILLIIYLAYHQDWLSRDALATFVRPDTDTATARQTLRQHLARARKFAWVAESLEVEKSRVRWQVSSDIQDFKAAIGQADWAKAVELYTGPLLAGLASQDSPTFDAWLEAERASLHNAWRKAARKQAQVYATSNDLEDAANLYKRLWDDDQLAEDSLQAYLKASYLAGQRDEALQAFEVFEKQLKEELELEPLEDTQNLIATIRRAENLETLESEVDNSQQVEVPITVLRPPILVGRAQEEQAVQASESPLTLVHGEAGVGKSRLLRSIFPDALYLKCQEGLEHVPYYPIVAYIRKHVLNLPKLGSYQADLARLIPEVDLQNAQASSEFEEPLDAETAKSRLLEALALVLDGQALIIDDLQWADAATFELLNFLVHKEGFRVYGTYRDDEVGVRLEDFLEGMRSGKLLKLVALGGLEPSSLSTLMATIMNLPEDQAPTQFSKWLFEKSGGNPFFALETLKALFQSQSLEIKDGIWQSDLDTLSRNYDDLALPPAVTQLIERRIKTLSDEARRVLSVACVMQTGFTAGQIAKVAALSEWATSEALAEAESKEIIDVDGFKHDLIRQALYLSLSESQRRFIHKSVADVLSSSLTSVLAPTNSKNNNVLKDPLIIAEHYFKANSPEAAAELIFITASIRYGEQAGFEAETIALYKKVIALNIDSVYVERAKAFLAGRYISTNEFDEAEVLVKDVLSSSQDAIARCSAYLQLCTISFMSGSIADAASSVEAAAELAEDLDEESLKVDVTIAHAIVAQHLGEFERSIEIVMPLLKANEKQALAPNHIHPINIVSANYADLGQSEKALEMYYRQLEITQKFNRKEQEVRVIADILSTLDDMGRVTEGIELGERALTLGECASTPPVHYNLGLAYYELNRIDDALAQVQSAIETGYSVNILALTYLLKADIHHSLGNGDEAQQAVASGLDVIKDSDRISAQAIVVMAAYKFGSDAQKTEVQEYVAGIDADSLPDYLQGDYKEVITTI